MAIYSMVSSWARSARELSHRPAITIDDGPSMTWGELHSRSNQLARRYAELGVAWGDIVTLAVPTSYDAVAALLAILKLGATPNPISANLSEREIRSLLELAKPSLIIAEAGTMPIDIPTIEPNQDLRGYDDSDLPEVIAPSFKAPTSGGSTGQPKLILSGSMAVIDDGPSSLLPAGQVVLSAGPLYHNTALTLILLGLSLRNHVVAESRFDAELTLRLIARHQVTHTVLVPTMMHRIWRLPPDVRESYDVSSLVLVMHNAAPCPPELKRAWIDWLGPNRLIENYTATEQSAVAMVTGTEWLQRPGTVGRAVSGDFKITDEHGNPCRPGEIGMIWMRRPAGTPPTYRYIGTGADSEETPWETVGDLGHMDADGYLFLADRRTDMIISGGANIYPAEIEGELAAHPGVGDCVVIGLPDEDLGKRVHAIVQLADPSVSEGELATFLSERLTRYKQPRSYEFVDYAFRNDAGKVRRTELADERSHPAVASATGPAL